MTKEVASLIQKKSSFYLNVSIVIFVISMLVLIQIITVNLSQYLKMDKQFIKNKNTHVIRIVYRSRGNNVVGLNSDDISRINGIIKSVDRNIKFEVIEHYRIPFGTVDDTGYTYFINGLFGKGELLLGINDNFQRVDNAYVFHLRKKSNKITLNIPEIATYEDGYITSKSSKMILNVKKINKKNTFVDIFDPTPEESSDLYVNERIYDVIYKKFFEDNKAEAFRYLNSLYIYVYDISKMNRIAYKLEKEGYVLSYVLRAFDNFSSMFNSIYWNLILTVIGVFLFSVMNLVFAFYLFLRLQQKDMGILYHLGFSILQIKKIYSYNINKIFYKISAISLLYIVFMFIYVNEKNTIYFLLLEMISVFILLLLIRMLIVECILKKFLNKKPIELLTYGKDFE